MILFGGSLTAELQRGRISRNEAYSVLAVLANTSLTLDSLVCEGNSVRIGTVRGDVSSTVAVLNTSMTNSKAKSSGTGVNVIYSRARVEGSTFTNNMATGAGALAAFSSDLTVRDCWFGGNRADTRLESLTNASARVSGLGGACLLDNSNASFTNSTFINNTALEGGAMRLQSVNMTLTGCHFERNGAAIGGAVSAVNNSVDCHPPKSRGGPSACVSQLLINHTTLQSNSARSDRIVNWVSENPHFHGVGGAIYYHTS